MYDTVTVTFRRLDALLTDGTLTTPLPLDETHRYAVYSDLHLGDGGGADNFTHNEMAFLRALAYYKEHGYGVILLGDIEEFWQFDLHEIRDRYQDTVYAALRDFPSDRVYRVFGNHDLEWGGMQDPAMPGGGTWRWAPEAIRLGEDLLLTHGHQGLLFSDKNTWISRFTARAFRYLEPLARVLGYESRDATKSQVPRDRERTCYRWAKQNRTFLVCGHTHRAIFASRSYADWLRRQIESKRTTLYQSSKKAKRMQLSGEIGELERRLDEERALGRDIESLEPDGDPLPCYFNSGCGLYRGGMTNLEIEAGTIRLVKWHNDGTLPPAEQREQYWEDGDLNAYREQLRSA